MMNGKTVSPIPSLHPTRIDIRYTADPSSDEVSPGEVPPDGFCPHAVDPPDDISSDEHSSDEEGVQQMTYMGGFHTEQQAPGGFLYDHRLLLSWHCLFLLLCGSFGCRQPDLQLQWEFPQQWWQPVQCVITCPWIFTADPL